ncbi:hypothetical protein AGDE_16854 [Angomonas deanei]|nr:hypothetical protein AGDE_16854 [Angomonas deanei]|eukprot:EPY16053.1 hypothetical protein AGDE_16854 [Angomonas deanei]
MERWHVHNICTLFGFPRHATLCYDPVKHHEHEKKEENEKSKKMLLPLFNTPSYYNELHQCWADGDCMTILIALSDLQEGNFENLEVVCG